MWPCEAIARSGSTSSLQVVAGCLTTPNQTKPLSEPMLNWDFWHPPSAISQEMHKLCWQKEILNDMFCIFQGQWAKQPILAGKIRYSWTLLCVFLALERSLTVLNINGETEMLPFWRNFLHRFRRKWQLLVTSDRKIPSKPRHYHFSELTVTAISGTVFKIC